MALDHRRGLTREEFLNTPEGKYRRLQGIAAQRAREYDGSEESDRSLWRALQDFESCAVEHGMGGSIIAQETDAASRLNPSNQQDIDILLAMAIRSLNAVVRESLEGRGTKIITKPFSGIYFPPGKKPVAGYVDGGSEWKHPRFDESVTNFLRLLRTIGVFTDDIMLLPELQQPETESVHFEGREVTLTRVQNPHERQMRELAYIRIEIPRLNRTVMLCDQVGEAAFVFEGIVSDQYLTTHKKEESETDGTYAVTKVRRGPRWADDMRAALLNDGTTGAGPKIDIVGWEDVRAQGIAALRETCPVEAWLQRGTTNLDIEVHPGMTLPDFGHKLGYRNLRARVFRLEIASLVWPDDERIRLELVEARTRERALQRTKEEWIDRVHEVLSAAQILAMSIEDARTRTYDGVLLVVIARAILSKEVTFKKRSGLLSLGTALYPEDRQLQRAYMEARAAEKDAKDLRDLRRKREPWDFA